LFFDFRSFFKWYLLFPSRLLSCLFLTLFLLSNFYFRVLSFFFLLICFEFFIFLSMFFEFFLSSWCAKKLPWWSFVLEKKTRNWKKERKNSKEIRSKKQRTQKQQKLKSKKRMSKRQERSRVRKRRYNFKKLRKSKNKSLKRHVKFVWCVTVMHINTRNHIQLCFQIQNPNVA